MQALLTAIEYLSVIASNRRGTSTVEYALVTAGVGVALLAAIQAFAPQLLALFNTLGAALNATTMPNG